MPNWPEVLEAVDTPGRRSCKLPWGEQANLPAQCSKLQKVDNQAVYLISGAPMQEAIEAVEGGRMYYRHNGFEKTRPTVVFIHGLGESGLCFVEAFHSSLCIHFNILVPDLPGFGKSPAAFDHDYGFSKQVARVLELLDRLEVGQIHIVGHSMGGDIGTLFCQEKAGRVLSFVNIEGNLTADNRYIVDQAMRAETEGCFEDWLRQDFAAKQVIEWAHQWPSTARYLASLNMCQADAFLASAHEIDRLIAPVARSNIGLIGQIYQQLVTPRVYCWGKDSLAPSAVAFLNDSGLENKEFEAAFHWVMLDQGAAFYHFLSDFLAARQ